MIDEASLSDLTSAEDWSDLDLLPRMRRTQDAGLADNPLDAYQLLVDAGEVPEIPDQDLPGSESEASLRSEPQGAELRRLERNAPAEIPVPRFDPEEFWWNRD